MDPKQRARLLIVVVALLCIGAVWGLVWYRARPISNARLLSRMPVENAVILNVDIDALRRAGILQLLDGSRAGLDPDYQQFVRRVNFDYRQDLDSFMIAFAPAGRFMLVRGRFDLEEPAGLRQRRRRPMLRLAVRHEGQQPRSPYFLCGAAE